MFELVFIFTLAYLKICDGFILICNSDKEESVKFIEKQIENIINFSPNFANFVVLVNKRKKNKIKKRIKEQLRNLVERYGVQVSIVKLNEERLYLMKIYDFISKVLYNKLRIKKDLPSKSSPNIVRPFECNLDRFN
jgi:hypothetical protein